MIAATSFKDCGYILTFWCSSNMMLTCMLKIKWTGTFTTVSVSPPVLRDTSPPELKPWPAFAPSACRHALLVRAAPLTARHVSRV